MPCPAQHLIASNRRPIANILNIPRLAAGARLDILTEPVKIFLASDHQSEVESSCHKESPPEAGGNRRLHPQATADNPRHRAPGRQPRALQSQTTRLGGRLPLPLLRCSMTLLVAPVRPHSFSDAQCAEKRFTVKFTVSPKKMHSETHSEPKTFSQ